MKAKRNKRLKRSRDIYSDFEFHSAMFLVKNNVPFDVAFGCDPEFRFAMVVKMAEFEGNDFNWETLTWTERK